MKEIDLKRKKRVSFLFFYLTDSMTWHAWRILASLEGKKMTEAIVCDRRSIGHVTGSCSSDPATCYSRNSFSKFGIKSTGHFKTESLLCRFFFLLLLSVFCLLAGQTMFSRRPVVHYVTLWRTVLVWIDSGDTNTADVMKGTLLTELDESFCPFLHVK